jgi:predicted ATPase
VRVLWELEERGFTLVEEDGRLVVRPESRITPTDDATIRCYRDELLALVQRETIQ